MIAGGWFPSRSVGPLPGGVPQVLVPSTVNTTSPVEGRDSPRGRLGGGRDEERGAGR
ncbi:hypothetical protein ACIGNX_29835 [Actinosynnema sp. NPDC053489]|uniref:hypothetical protein n=1 Tax=Actinosynnema sp. NPDC053489 TaxID=3363916 RepID=UPI0037C9926C